MPWSQIPPLSSYPSYPPFPQYKVGLCRKQRGQVRQQLSEAGLGPGLEGNTSPLGPSDLRANPGATATLSSLEACPEFFLCFLSEALPV